MNFPRVCAHACVEAISKILFVLRVRFRLNALIRVFRNMAAVMQGDDPTLINPPRLDESEPSRLDSLDALKHTLRLGAMHGQDDRFYMHR